MDEQVERHESKQDVFEDALDELRYAISLAKEPVAAEDLSGDELLNDLRARYAAAGKVAVPGEVARYLRWGKTFNIPLHVMFNFKFVRNQGLSPLNDGIEEWICDSPDDFALAWLDGQYAEEDTK